MDISPTSVRSLRQEGLDAMFGDVADPEFIATLPLAGTRWVVSTVREHMGGLDGAEGRLVLAQALRHHGFGGTLAVTVARAIG